MNKAWLVVAAFALVLPPANGGCGGSDFTSEGQGGAGATSTASSGGDPCAQCATGKLCDPMGRCVDCLTDSACHNGEFCGQGDCQPTSCADGTKNGAETDVDCGGGECSGCKPGEVCQQGTDCKSQVCEAMKCKPPSCEDGFQNGGEAGVDCGGQCPPCVRSCTDGLKDGDETDIDCGGGCPVGCADMQSCVVGNDCASGFCIATICVSQCANGVADGSETDVDCGGDCPTCVLGQTCACPQDCITGLCCDNAGTLECQADSGGSCTSCM